LAPILPLKRIKLSLRKIENVYVSVATSYTEPIILAPASNCTKLEVSFYAWPFTDATIAFSVNNSSCIWFPFRESQNKASTVVSFQICDCCDHILYLRNGLYLRLLILIDVDLISVNDSKSAS
jgi:hypothetical protein